MLAMLLFPKETPRLEAKKISATLKEAFAVTSSAWVDGKKKDSFPKPTDGTLETAMWVDLPELNEAEEGQPVVRVIVSPRLDRDEDTQKMVDELVSQEPSMDKLMNKNASDVALLFDDSSASFEAAALVAYAISAQTETGILVPAYEDGEETIWFENADDFAEEVFASDEDEDEEGEDEEDEDEDNDKR